MASNLLRIEVLTKDNYDTWKLQMLAVLIKSDAWCYVNGECKMPERKEEDAESEAAYKAWKTNDEKAKSDIILSISASEWKQVKSCETSHEMWKKLEDIYQSRGPAKKATLLKRLILHKMQENEDIHAHVGKFFDAVDKLQDINVDINPDVLAVLLLYSLPNSFENFRYAIESRDALPDPETLRVKVIEEHDARKNQTTEAVPNAMIASRYHGKPKFSKREKIALAPLYQDAQPITYEKYKDIKQLLLYIPPVHHAYFETLPHAGHK